MSNICPLCDSSDFKTKFIGFVGKPTLVAESLYQCTSISKAKPQLNICKNCSHVFSDRSTWPNLSSNEYENVSDPRYLDLEFVKDKTFERAAILTSKFFTEPTDLIEIGSYTGIFLTKMAQRGWRTLGIEPSLWASKISQDKGLKIIPKPFEAAISTNVLPKVDLVVSWDVLEHVQDPRSFISGVSNQIKKDGFFIFSTLDRSNFFARLTGRFWPWIIPMHLHYFHKKSLIKIVSSYGFNFIETGPHVHYANLEYILKKLIPLNLENKNLSFFRRIVLPVGFGDVRYFIFQKREFN